MVTSDWLGENGTKILSERTTFIFEKAAHKRWVTRIAALTAGNDTVYFKDNKEGLLAVRMARFLEHPSQKPDQFIDSKGNITQVPVLSNEGVTGKYRNSEGLAGEEVWGKRASWVNLSGFTGKDSVGVCIFDHSKNPGYPGHWHARGYGLFSSNGLGARIFSEGKEELNFKLPPGATVYFAYKILVWEGKPPSVDEIGNTQKIWLNFDPNLESQ
jgi:hypothetical protein